MRNGHSHAYLWLRFRVLTDMLNGHLYAGDSVPGLCVAGSVRGPRSGGADEAVCAAAGRCAQRDRLSRQPRRYRVMLSALKTLQSVEPSVTRRPLEAGDAARQGCNLILALECEVSGGTSDAATH